jgi:threonine dehydrogenase-like Zn-dependent dehydrogenase
MGQTHVQAYTKPLLEKIIEGKIDPSFVVTHPASLEDAPEMYQKFRDKICSGLLIEQAPTRPSIAC